MQKTTYEESISPKKSRLYGAIRGLKRRAKKQSPAKGGENAVMGNHYNYMRMRVRRGDNRRHNCDSDYLRSKKAAKRAGGEPAK